MLEGSRINIKTKDFRSNLFLLEITLPIDCNKTDGFTKCKLSTLIKIQSLKHTVLSLNKYGKVNYPYMSVVHDEIGIFFLCNKYHQAEGSYMFLLHLEDYNAL